MGAVARGVEVVDGGVVGAIRKFMKSRELAYLEADDLVTVQTMAEREQAIIARADGFLALPGGIGTLEEIAEVLTLRYLAQLDKPVVFFNQNGFYHHLLRFFQHLGQERFRSMDGLFAVANTRAEIWPHLENPPRATRQLLWRKRR